MVGVIGPDGVGKSTLSALISGVRTIQSGKVSIFDQNVANRAHLKSIRGRIAYMPQGLGRNLYPTLSVFRTSTSSVGCLGNRLRSAARG